MAGETYLTLSGNLTSPPKSGVSRSGVHWTRMRVASSSRVFDRGTTEWRDGETIFLDVSCWRRLAENAAATLERGDRVLVIGRLRQRSYEDQQGVRHTVMELDADAIGPDLGRVAARLSRPDHADEGDQPDESPESQESPESPVSAPVLEAVPELAAT
ncbi:MAG TPA: single-stranded DNA-binding protein [Frankiaceae bacterium]|jgi:single-strand DNA-binding protein|nr:single-stranded DNA-binding protein [Frankiaceae bacterium]